MKPLSCHISPPEIVSCLEDTAACPPALRDNEKCADSPADCLPQSDGGERKDSDEAIAVPVERKDPPGDGGASSGGVTEEDESAPSTSAASETSRGTTDRAELSSTALETGGILEEVGSGVTQAAQQFAFPLMLATAAAVFLLVQGRIDRNDPKLTVAPVDARDDLVHFE